MAELKPIYLLSGNDDLKIERALVRLRGRFGQGAEQQVNAKSVSGADAVALLRSFTLGASGRLVVVSESERWKKPDAEALEAYVQDPDPDALLVLLGSPAARSSVLSLVQRYGEQLSFKLSSSDIPRWAAEELARRGAKATRGAVRTLIALKGSDPLALLPELEKLACYAGDEPLDEAGVLAVVAADPTELSAFALNDAWGARDVKAALSACEILASRGDKRQDELRRSVGSLGAHVRRVLLCQGLRKQGVGPEQAGQTYGLHPYVARKCYEQARRFTNDELTEALLTLGRLSGDLQGGSPLPPLLLVERAVLAII